MAEKVYIGPTRQRGQYKETPVYDRTRVGHPTAAKIFRLGGDFLVVPENDMYPVVLRDSLSAAVSFVEQIIPDEGGSF